MDAVVAQAYRLTRPQYARILDSFSHRSFLAAPSLCMAAFDELASKDLVQFCGDHDPYCDIPLVTTPAQPVIRLPDAAGQSSKQRVGLGVARA
jgi:hypothetical protein